MKKGFGNTTAGLFSSYPYQGYLDEEGKNKNSYEKMIHKAKIPVPFKGSSHPNKTFTPDYVDYNKDNELKCGNNNIGGLKLLAIRIMHYDETFNLLDCFHISS